MISERLTRNDKRQRINNTSKTNVAPWCFKWMDGLGWMDLRVGIYRSYGAYRLKCKEQITNYCAMSSTNIKVEICREYKAMMYDVHCGRDE